MSRRAWRVRANGRIWKRPRKMKEALELARHLLHGTDFPVTIEPFEVPVKRRRQWWRASTAHGDAGPGLVRAALVDETAPAAVTQLVTRPLPHADREA